LAWRSAHWYWGGVCGSGIIVFRQRGAKSGTGFRFGVVNLIRLIGIGLVDQSCRLAKPSLTNQCTRIAKRSLIETRWACEVAFGVEVGFAGPQSRDFRRYLFCGGD
jgi:hypothetical protein